MDGSGVEAPRPDEDDDETRKLVNAIWAAGWKAGDKHGYDLGHTNGKSVFSNFWATIAVVLSFALGAWTFTAIDWFQTCYPTMVGEEKSCITRVGE